MTFCKTGGHPVTGRSREFRGFEEPGSEICKEDACLFGSSTSLHYLSIDFSHIFECLQSVYICLYRKCLLAHMFVSNIYAFLSLKYCLILFPDSILDTSISLLVVVLFKFLAATRSTFLKLQFLDILSDPEPFGFKPKSLVSSCVYRASQGIYESNASWLRTCCPPSTSVLANAA